MKVKDYIGIEFESGTRRTQQYINFEKQCRKELNAMISRVASICTSFSATILSGVQFWKKTESSFMSTFLT